MGKMLIQVCGTSSVKDDPKARTSCESRPAGDDNARWTMITVPKNVCLVAHASVMHNVSETVSR